MALVYCGTLLIAIDRIARVHIYARLGLFWLSFILAFILS